MGALTGLKNAVDHFGTSACSKGLSLIESLRAWCCSRTLPSKYNVSGTKRTLSKVLGLLTLFKGPYKLLTCRPRSRPGRWQDVQTPSTSYPYPGRHMQRGLALETVPVWSKMSVACAKSVLGHSTYKECPPAHFLTAYLSWEYVCDRDTAKRVHRTQPEREEHASTRHGPI